MQMCTRLRWPNAMFQKRRFRMVWSDSLNLPVLSLLCAWARHLKTRTQRSQAICTSVLPASKTPVNQKSLIILTPCISTQRKRTKTRKLTKKVTEFLYQAVELPTSNCSIFTENEGLVLINVTVTNHDFGPDYKLHYPKLHGSPPSGHLVKVFSQFTTFEQLALALKNKVALKISTVLNIRFTFRSFD